jgi:dihydrofolate reductase
MRKISVFNFVTLDGYFEGSNRDISWAQHDAEGDDFSMEGLSSGATLLFGRVTYQLMASYWPTPLALKNTPVVAQGMNNAQKIVFSRTLQQADWKNTTLMKDNIVEEMKKIKQTSGNDMTLLGSGSILTQFAEQGLIDEYQILVNPVVVGDGTPIFKGVGHRLNLKLMSTRTFKNGNVLLCYEPAAGA